MLSDPVYKKSTKILRRYNEIKFKRKNMLLIY